MKKQSHLLREAIEEMIATGELQPGHYLEEGELASKFGVSRTPIREALIQLGSMGIVEMRPRRRAIVAQIDPQTLLEMFEVMAELEAMCGRLAARRMSAEEHKALKQAYEACSSARTHKTQDAYYYANEKFHQLIYEGSHNRFLAEQAANLHRRLRPYRRLQLRIRARVQESNEDHAKIVKMILAGDEEGAVTALRKHITMHGQRFSELMAFLSSMGGKAA